MKKLTPEEYKQLSNNHKSNAEVLGEIDVTESKTKKLLREMGEYFELDKKKVAFFIKQYELSGKL